MNTGYITRSKLSDHLRSSQQALSDYMIAAGAAAPKGGSKRERLWPRLPSRRIGDEQLDPTPPDPRVGVPWSEENRSTRLAAKLARAA